MGAKLSAGYQTTGNQKTRWAGFIKDEQWNSLKVDAVFQSCVFYAATISLGGWTRA